MIRLTTIAILVLAIAKSSASAQPQPPTNPPNNAAAWLAKAANLYSVDADFPAALIAFRRAYALEPSWKALNGIGLSQERLGDFVDAYRTFDKLLADFGATLTESQRSKVEAKRAELDAQIGRVEIRLGENTDGARVTLDGAELSGAEIAGPHLVTPGGHAVVVTRDGFQPFADEVDVKAGEKRAVEVELLPEKEKVVVKIEEAPLVRRMPRWVPWATLAGGVVIAGAGGLFALSAKSDFDDFDAQIAAAAGGDDGFPRASPGDDDLRDSGESKRTIATGLFVTAGITAAVGVTLVILNQPRRGKTTPEPTTSLLVGPRSIGVSMRF